jgi:hypothetical protein
MHESDFEIVEKKLTIELVENRLTVIGENKQRPRRYFEQETDTKREEVLQILVPIPSPSPQIARVRLD